MSEKSDKRGKSAPALADWASGPSGWLHAFGSFDHAQAFSTLFWPGFITHDGCTFLDFDEKLYADWLVNLKGDKTAVEAMMNHRHICDLLPEPSAERKPTREQVLFVGRVLKEMWSCKLRRDFPAKHFTVSFPEDYNEDLVDYEISFFHNPNREA